MQFAARDIHTMIRETEKRAGDKPPERDTEFPIPPKRMTAGNRFAEYFRNNSDKAVILTNYNGRSTLQGHSNMEVGFIWKGMKGTIQIEGFTESEVQMNQILLFLAQLEKK